MSTDPREAIRHLLRPREPADALASYYAFYHPQERTTIVPYPEGATRATGYVALSRTGIDLFRPLVTMRLPATTPAELDLEAGVILLRRAVPAGSPVIIHTDSRTLPLLRAICQIDREQPLRLLRLNPRRYEPLINIFVARSDTPDGFPRFAVRNPPGDPNGTIVASAGVNWMSPTFADVVLRTQNGFRRQGYARSVLSSLIEYLIGTGRSPLYTVDAGNEASLELARDAGFVDTLSRPFLLEAVLRAPSQAL